MLVRLFTYVVFSSRSGSTVKGQQKRKVLDWLSLCCFDASYDKFYLVRDAAIWWRKLDSGSRRRLNVRRRRFAGWHKLEMFAIPPRKHDLFYQTIEPVWIGSERICALGIRTLVVFLYVTDEAQSGTGLERGLVQKVAEVEYNVSSLGAFLHSAQYCPAERLAYPWMVAGCEGGGALLRVSLCTIKSWYALGVCRLLRNIAVDPVLALVAIGRLMNINWEAIADQE